MEITKKKIDVWVIDDDEDYCRMLAKGLRCSKSVTCNTTFQDCPSAIRFLRESPVHPEVILLDVNFPRIDGLEAIWPIKQTSPETHIIMLTGSGEDENIRKAMKLGISGYLFKTTKLSGIVSSIEAVAQGGIPMDPMVIRKVISMFGLATLPAADYGLSGRETEVLRLTVAGQTKQEIASNLSLSFHTIDTHYKNIFAKLDVHSVQAMIAKALKDNLL